MGHSVAPTKGKCQALTLELHKFLVNSLQKGLIPIKMSYICSQTHPAFSSRRMHVDNTHRTREKQESLSRKHMTGGWARKKMGLLCVDWGIKCVASISSYLPIPLLFYGQSWIMLSSVNECGGQKINGTFPASMWPGLPLWGLVCFWCLEMFLLLGLMMAETFSHAFLQPPIFLLTEKWLKVVSQRLFVKAIHELKKITHTHTKI